jgi:hypothetical protein
MTPGYNHGTVYVSTVPVNPAVGEYLAGGKGILWALNARAVSAAAPRRGPLVSSCRCREAERSGA